MGLRDDFQGAAGEIFEIFKEFIIQAVYIAEESVYVPGGDVTPTRTEYPIRLIRDEEEVTFMAGDISIQASQYMMITSELPVPARVKDRLRIGEHERGIVGVLPADPGSIVTMLQVGNEPRINR